MRKPMTALSISVAAVLIFVTACKKFEDIRIAEEVAYDAEFAVPLVNARISLQDILDGEDDLSILEINDDGSMTLKYEAELQSYPSSDLLEEMPDLPFAVPDPATEIPIQFFDNFAINSISLKSGTLSFNFQSGLTEDIDVTITLPQLTKNGVPFSADIFMDYQGSLPVSAAITPVSIEGYALELNGNVLQINYEATTASNESVVLDLVTGIAENWQFEIVTGTISQQTFNIAKDTIEIDLFDSQIDGEISFEDPKINVRIENSYGFPVTVQLKNVMVITAEGDEMEVNLNGNSFEINYPGMNETGESKTTAFILDKDNSNIREILSARPTKLYFEIDGILNPENSVDPGFVMDQSDLTAILDLELPIYGTASGFTLETTAEIDLNDMDNISSAEFKVVTDNMMPIDLGLQLYFRDGQENILDSLFEQRKTILAAADVDVHGNTTTPKEMITFVSLPKERMDMVQNAKSVLIQASFSTLNYGNTPVVIKTSQDVVVRVGAKFGVEN